VEESRSAEFQTLPAGYANAVAMLALRSQASYIYIY